MSNQEDSKLYEALTQASDASALNLLGMLTRMAKVFHKTMLKPSSGISKRRNKAMPMPRTTWG